MNTSAAEESVDVTNTVNSVLFLSMPISNVLFLDHG